MLLVSVFQRLQQNRAAASCAAGQRYPEVGLAQDGKLFVCLERPAHQVSPLLSTRRLAGVRYQLDFELAQAGIVGNGRHQEDPVVRSCDRYPHTDAICRNVITPLAHRFRQQRNSSGGSVVSRERLRDRERLAWCDTQVESET